VSKPSSPRRPRGKQADHRTAREPRYATPEQQQAELLAYRQRRDAKVARALVVVLSADVGVTVLKSIGVLMEYVANQGRRDQARRDADQARRDARGPR